MGAPQARKDPPYFYSSTSRIVSDWDTYKDLVLNQVGAIILNTHGEALPVPCGYSWDSWIGVIANAMSLRRLTWINVGGYPFYYAIYGELPCAAQLVTLGEQGFRTLLAPVLGSSASAITLFPPAGLLNGGITGVAESNLRNAGWKDLKYVDSVAAYRVLKASDFQDIAILPLYSSQTGICPSCENYWEGAVLAFARTNMRFDPDLSSGFGTFVHLATTQTYSDSNSPTDANYYQGYAAVSAALLVESAQFSVKSNEVGLGLATASLKVNPVVLGSSGPLQSPRTIRLGFGLYGGYQTCCGDRIRNVQVRIANGNHFGVTLQAQLGLSRSGQGVNGVKLQGLGSFDDGFMTPVESVLLLAAAWPPAEPFVAAAGGVILFYDWTTFAAGLPERPISEQGVDSPDTLVRFSYVPAVEYHQNLNYLASDIFEFQSIVIIDVFLDTSLFTDWAIIPVGYSFRVETVGGPTVEVSGGATLAAWIGTGGNSVEVFYDDFEGDTSDWARGDSDPGADLDYWGVGGTEITSEPSAMWVGQVGANSIYGGPNTNAGSSPPSYDKNMNAYLEHDLSYLNLKAYNTVVLRYRIQWAMRPGDYLYVQLGSQTPRTYSGYSAAISFFQTWNWDEIPVPLDALSLRFRFVSNDDSDVWWGVGIDDIEIIATISNDAGTHDDAGDAHVDATPVFPGGETNPAYYYAYLALTSDDPEDWYKFPVNKDYVVHLALSNLASGEICSLN